ncbi:unnamed protein product [Nyctereutes procyonoides]|uniref:(raccoon dog) hypothetical protein n=1 Tax=Nyctereutes procyonoides TaxID=34880 RepID=A0A811ZDJ8_NYCPR|nr:unnamed protein product [Nyctereutes procyonoides]
MSIYSCKLPRDGVLKIFKNKIFYKRDKYEKKKYYDKNSILKRLWKKDNQQLEFRKSINCKNAAEPTAPVTNGNITTVSALNDIWTFWTTTQVPGPRISNPLPATLLPPVPEMFSIPGAANLSTVISGDLHLFTEQATKSEEVAKNKLSKDSILSLYSTGNIQRQRTPGVFKGPTNRPFTSQAPNGSQDYPSVGVPVAKPVAPGLLGNVMGQSGKHDDGQAHAQWMNQPMAGMRISSTNPTVDFDQPPSPAAGWSGGSSSQTLSTQLWK